MVSKYRIHPVLAIGFGIAIGGIGCSSSDDGSSGAETLRILVTNDDGVGAPGIDALVQALVADPNNEVIVSAPVSNSSGSGDTTIADDPPPDCARGTGNGTEAATQSGYDTNVWAVDGCPADAVIFGLGKLYPDEAPHVVLSGINEGQNVGNVAGALSQLSGTVGSAKTAACLGIPALASSQGDPEDNLDPANWDYESGVAEVLRWLEANRSALLGGGVSVENITSINIPTCDAGAIRGRVEVPLGTEIPDYVSGLLDEQDCESTLEDPQDDIEAFFNGFVAITPVSRNSSGTCDNLGN
jgi:5'-nucleotidase